ENVAETTRDGGIKRKRLRPREARAQLHAPWSGRPFSDAPFEGSDEQARRFLDQRNELAASRLRRLARNNVGIPSDARPFVDTATRDDLDIAQRLAGKLTATVEPILHPARARIVGRGRKPEIAEL